MQDQGESSGREAEERPADSESGSRPQRAGEAETTRFGMEDGDNTDVPATGGPTADGDEGKQSS